MKIRIDALDVLFSKYIRLRDKVCQRCGSSRSLQCSHLFGRTRKSVRWDEENCCALCFGCHMYFTAQPIEHIEWFIARLGKQKFEMLQHRARTLGKPDKEAITLYLKENIKRLKEE